MITTANKAWPDLKSASVTLHRRQTFRRIQQSCKRQLISNTLMSNTNTNTSKSDQLTELQSCKMLHISNTMTIDHAEMNNISPGIIFQKEFHEYQHFHIKPIYCNTSNEWKFGMLTTLRHLLYLCWTPSIVKGNKSLNLVWSKWGSQWWGLQCVAISHWSNGFSADEEYWNISLKQAGTNCGASSQQVRPRIISS